MPNRCTLTLPPNEEVNKVAYVMLIGREAPKDMSVMRPYAAS